MTLTDLERYRQLKIRHEEAIQMIEELRSRAVPGSPALDGMPHGSGVSDKVGTLAIMIADLEAKLPSYERQILKEHDQVEEFIRGIEDDKTRMIFRLRFQAGKTWKEVADVMGMWQTENSVRSRVYRFLNLDANGNLED
jgi:DNA-directed RNA polymerase specialized sigma subunit